MTRWRITGLAVVLVAIVGAVMLSRPRNVEVVMPDLSPRARQGQVLFEANCGLCHGASGGGSEQGPPLIHVIYEPSHHADMAFVAAVQNGVRAHHWPYGDMPPVEGLGPSAIGAIIAFVREVQVANGIE